VDIEFVELIDRVLAVVLPRNQTPNNPAGAIAVRLDRGEPPCVNRRLVSVGASVSKFFHEDWLRMGPGLRAMIRYEVIELVCRNAFVNGIAMPSKKI